MQFNVTTTGLTITLTDLDITLNHPSTTNLYDDGGDNKYSPSEITDSLELQEALTNGTLTASNENGDPITAVTPDIYLPNIVSSTATFYSYFTYWAEESGGLNANGFEWSWGNGDEAPANGGLEVPIDCELYAVTVTGSNGSGAIVEIYKQGTTTGAQNLPGGQSTTTQLTTPIIFTEGETVDFRTINIGTGVTAGCRVAAHFRVNLGNIPAIQGVQGPAGNDGVGGVPNTCARIVCTGNTNINATAYTEVNLSTTITPNTIGASSASNEITLPAGTYESKAVFSTTSTAQRPNQEIRLMVNGVEYSSEFGEGYIRTTSGHSEAKVTHTDIFVLGAIGTISYEMRGISAAGTVVLDGTRSKVLIHQIA